MVVTILSSSDVRTRAVASLGLAGCDDLLSQEGLSALVRRTAGFLCPCPASALVRVTYDALDSFVTEPNAKERLRTALEDTVEAMLAYGDLIELPADGGQNGRRGTLIAAAPPRFVSRQSGAAYIMGVAPDNVSFLSPELNSRVERRGHVRRLTPNGENPVPALKRAGLAEWSEREWLYAPPKQPAAQVLSQLEVRLRGAGLAGEIDDLEILDPSMPPDFYIKRWRKADRQTGLFVARRPKTYGSALWCYVALDAGRPVHVIDFPTPGASHRGCDEAFYVQAAIDAARGKPQFITVTAEEADTTLVRFFSPLPEWVRRRLDIFGSPRGRSGGGLLVYSLPAAEAAQEIEFLRTRLWMMMK